MTRLSAHSLKKSYRSRQVVCDLSLEINTGEVVGLLGPNGAGKTTAFYMIVGLIPADGGSILLDDRDLTPLSIDQRARLGLGYLPQEASVFRKLSVADNIMAILELRDELDRAGRELRLEELLEELRIGHVRNTRGLSLSGGERRRVEMARAGGRTALHSARRTLCRCRSAVGTGYPAHYSRVGRSRDRGSGDRP